MRLVTTMLVNYLLIITTSMVSTFAIPVSSSPHRIISNQAWLAEVCIMKSSTTLSPCVAKSYYECHDSAGFTYNKECEAGTQYDESSRQLSGLSSSTKEEEQQQQQSIIDDPNINNLDLITPPDSHILKLMDSTKTNKTKRDEEDDVLLEKPDRAIISTLCNDYKKYGKKPYIRDPHSCIRYYKCMQGVQKEDDRLVAIWFECNNGYAYNENTGKCDRKNTLPKCIIEKNSGISIHISSSHLYFSMVGSWMVIISASVLFT
ncbi:hypothetical protein BDC45DRAFT_610356 [Circinella umbellata]|nr:hypothetical protein BDC45DRAFT_610356 [Circinella umbellata]